MYEHDTQAYFLARENIIWKRQENTTRKIVIRLNLPTSTVKAIAKNFQKTGTLTIKARREPVIILQPQMVEEIRRDYATAENINEFKA